jgi:hypothetical protein
MGACGHELTGTSHGDRTCRYPAGHRELVGIDGRRLLPAHSDGVIVWGPPTGVGDLPDDVEQQQAEAGR